MGRVELGDDCSSIGSPVQLYTLELRGKPRWTEPQLTCRSGGVCHAGDMATHEPSHAFDSPLRVSWGAWDLVLWSREGQASNMPAEGWHYSGEATDAADAAAADAIAADESRRHYRQRSLVWSRNNRRRRGAPDWTSVQPRRRRGRACVDIGPFAAPPLHMYL